MSPHVVALVRLRTDRPRASDVRHWRDLIARVEHVNAHGDIRLARAGVGVARPVSPSPKQTPAQVALGGGSALSTVNQLSTFATASMIPVMNAARQENSRRSLRTPITLKPPLANLPVRVIFEHPELSVSPFPTLGPCKFGMAPTWKMQFSQFEAASQFNT